MKIEKVINDIKEWFKKNESSLENELLTCWDDDKYIINGYDISKELKPYSLMVYPVDDAPTLADNRWELCCDVYPYKEMADFGYDGMIVDGYSKNGVVDAIIKAVTKLSRNKTDAEKIALQALYRHPMWIEYDINTTKGKIEVLFRKLNTFTTVENLSNEELEIVLSDLEDMYLENIGYRKPNCK